MTSSVQAVLPKAAPPRVAPSPAAAAPAGASSAAARLAGVLWLVTIVLGLYAMVGVRSALVVPGDAAATARHLLAEPTRWRLGVVADLAATGCYAGVVVLVTRLLAPAGSVLAGLALAFGLVGSAVAGLNGVHQLAALQVLEDPAIAGALGAAAPALMRLFLRLHGGGLNVALVFFSGLFLPLAGVLALRTPGWPRALGWLLVVAGACYLVDAAGSLVVPAAVRPLEPWIYLPCLVAEAAVTGWLLVGGPARTRRARAGGRG